MSAIDDMIRTQKSTPLSALIIAASINISAEYAELAASELAAMRARIAQLEADVATMEVTEYEAERFAPEYERQIKEPLEQRIAELEASNERAADILATVSLEAFSVKGSSLLHMKSYVRDECETWLNAWIAAHPEQEPVTP
jgi:hypothetical protein